MPIYDKVMPRKTRDTTRHDTARRVETWLNKTRQKQTIQDKESKKSKQSSITHDKTMHTKNIQDNPR